MDGQHPQVATDRADAGAIHAFLIADIRGYSTFTSRRGAAAAARLASTFTELSRDAIAARGGRLLGLRGDEVLAAFESPGQAVGAALDIRSACDEAGSADPDLPLRIGAGVDLGDAVVVDDGYHGAAINRAARLCARAGPGQVLVTRTIVDRLRDEPGLAFRLEATVAVKGFDDPVEMHAVAERPRPPIGHDAPGPGPDGPPGSDGASGSHGDSGPGGGPGPDGSSAGPDRVAVAPPAGLPWELDDPSVLAGRTDELSWLRGHWRAARRGRGRVVVVAGPTGAGKTRLAAELARAVGPTGDAVHYIGAGRAGPGRSAIATVGAVGRAGGPGLWIVDDLDTDPSIAAALDAARPAVARGAALVVAVVRDVGREPAIAALVDGVGRDSPGSGIRHLPPLDVEAVREIARSYVPDIDDLPAESIGRTSGGLPSAIHELVTQWAGDEARRRLAAAAEWLAEGTTRRAADLRFADRVIAGRLDRIYDPGPIADRIDRCPYKGLEAFDAVDAPYFFGREQLIGEMAARTVGAGFLAVVGPSGSGKSSAVIAGLVPSLQSGLLPGSQRWTPVVIRPGDHPLATLGSSRPARGPGEVELLVVDQFEEVFTTTTDSPERDAFIAELVTLAGDPDVVVVVTMRADYTGHCAPYPELAALLAANLVLVGPMTPDQLRRVIEAPARRVGLRVESALVETLVAEVVGEPGGLPLLSTALVQLWQARRDGWLRLDAHRRAGGVRTAVARLAESAYEQLSDTERAAARTILLRLVDAGEGDSAVRRRVTADEFDLDDDPTTAAVVSLLIRARLLTRDDDRIEIAHEALVREWPRLATWLAEDAAGRQLRGHLTHAARQWADHGRDPGDLYQGARLSAALDWSRAHEDSLNQVEREFLSAGRAASQAQLVHERRVNRRLQTLLAGTAVFLVAALIAGGFALRQRDHARAAQRTAQNQALRSDAERVGTLAQTEPNLDRSLLLAVAAVRLDDIPETRSDLLAALQRTPSAFRIIRPSTSEITGVAISSDGTTLVTGDASGAVRFDSLRTWAAEGPPVRLPAPIAPNAVRYSPDGHTVAVAAGQGDQTEVFVIDVSSRRLRRIGTWSGLVPPEPRGSTAIAFSPDGAELAVGLSPWSSNVGTPVSEQLVVLDPVTGRVRWRRPYPTTTGQQELQVAFSADGTLVTSAEQGSTDLWDARTGQLRRTYPVGGRFAVSPDGSEAAIGVNTADPTYSATSMVLLDLRSGRTRTLGVVPAATWTSTVAWTPDGRTVLDGSLDGDVRTWSVATGQIVDTFASDAGGRTQIAVDPSGRTVVSGLDDGSVLAWDLAGDQAVGRTFAWSTPDNSCPDSPCVAVNPAGTVMATDESDGTVDLIDLRTHRWAATLPAGHGIANGLAFTPGGQLVTGDEGGQVTWWDTATRTAVRRLHVAGPVYSVAVSPDGRLLAVQIQPDGTSTTTVELIDVATGALVRSYRVPDGAGGVAFRPDSRVIAALGCCSPGSVVDLWDTATGRPLPNPRIGGDLLSIAFRPGSGELAIGTAAGQVHLWDTTKGPSGAEDGPPITVAASNVLQVAVSPDGRLLAASLRDGSTDLIDLDSRQSLGGTFPVIGGDITAPLFTATGDLLINYVGTATDWPTGPAAWAADACRVAGRDLTPSEWSAVLPDRRYETVCPPAAHP